MKTPSAFVINPHSANLLRFSALVIGTIYGAYRYSSLCTHVKKRTERREIENKIQLAKEGKLLYQAYMDEKMKQAARDEGIIVDMDSLDYDAEKHILWLVDRIEKESSSPPKSDNKK